MESFASDARVYARRVRREARTPDTPLRRPSPRASDASESASLSESGSFSDFQAPDVRYARPLSRSAHSPFSPVASSLSPTTTSHGSGVGVRRASGDGLKKTSPSSSSASSSSSSSSSSQISPPSTMRRRRPRQDSLTEETSRRMAPVVDEQAVADAMAVDAAIAALTASSTLMPPSPNAAAMLEFGSDSNDDSTSSTTDFAYVAPNARRRRPTWLFDLSEAAADEHRQQQQEEEEEEEGKKARNGDATDSYSTAEKRAPSQCMTSSPPRHAAKDNTSPQAFGCHGIEEAMWSLDASFLYTQLREQFRRVTGS